MNTRSTNILGFWYCFIAVATCFPEMPQALSEDSVYSSTWDVELKKMSEQSRLLKRMNLDAPIRVNLSGEFDKYHFVKFHLTCTFGKSYIDLIGLG